MTTKTIAAEITDAAIKEGQNGRYAEIQVLEQGRKYPVTLRAFDPKLVERFEKAPRLGKGLAMGFVIEEQQGVFQGKAITYRNLVGLTTVAEAQTKTPAKAATPEPEAEPFPVPGAIPVGGKPATAAAPPTPPDAPQTSAKAASTHSEDKVLEITLPIARAYRWARTFNLGNYETERFELEIEAPPDWSDAQAFAHIQERIAAARAALPADVSKRAAAVREGPPL